MFRERSRGSNLPPLPRHQQQALADKFLKAIGEERQKEEDEEYRKQLRTLWNRYQDEEGDIERELFDNEVEPDYDGEDRKRNRQVKKSFFISLSG